MSGVVAFEGELNGIVKEYLDFNKFDRTAHFFERECSERGIPPAPLNNEPKTNQKMVAIQNELIQLYQQGRRQDFFTLWRDYLSKKLRDEDAVSQKLEFYLNIYFAIFPTKYNRQDTEDGMGHFKVYLETRGSSLSQTTEFLPYYALPFVPNPKTHPSYKELFSDQWVMDLRTRVEKFLTLALQARQQPRLFELYRGGGGKESDLPFHMQAMIEKRIGFDGRRLDAVEASFRNYDGLAVDQLQKELQGSEKRVATYTKRYNRVQADYHNLIGITADLVDSLEATVQGRPVSPDYLQRVCARLFSNQIRQSVDLTRPGTAAAVLRESALPPQGLEHTETTPTKSFDWAKIKRDLVGGGAEGISEHDQGLLLQSLRWKLTKSAPPERDAIMTEYTSNDLMGCKDTGKHRTAVLDLLQSDSELIRQYTARLFNAFASLAEGRTYLSHNSQLLGALIENLRTEKKDSITRENVLGCLQKLSLKRQQQSMMIEEGIIAWLVSTLEDDDVLSDYTLEYSVALLMNLCLRSGGKRKCAENAQQVLKVLSDLLGHDNHEIIPYVNGAMYSILAIPSIREEARAMDMESILKCFIKDGQSDMNRQIEFIIKQLNSDEEPEEAESDDEDDEEDEEDQDALEVDLDKAELIKLSVDELSGDRLLNSRYVTTTSSPTRRKRGHLLDQVKAQDEMLTRPVTPSHMKGADNALVHIPPRTSQSDNDRWAGPRPPTGTSRQNGSRPSSSQGQYRPPTRSGSRSGSRGQSRPGTSESSPRTPRTPVVPTDPEGTSLIGAKTGRIKPLAKMAETGNLKPSTKAIEKVGPQADIQEYSAAFGSRPRISRTADGRPTSRGQVGDGPPPQPKYSDSLPTSRPNSGGRPSSSGNSAHSPTNRPSSNQGKKPSSRGKVR